LLISKIRPRLNFDFRQNPKLLLIGLAELGREVAQLFHLWGGNVDADLFHPRRLHALVVVALLLAV